LLKNVESVFKVYVVIRNIPEPPHFPVDRIIQIKLIEQSKTTILIKIEAWTQFNDEKHYLKVIQR
jgi:hypothetical protein